MTLLCFLTEASQPAASLGPTELGQEWNVLLCVAAAERDKGCGYKINMYWALVHTSAAKGKYLSQP